MNKIPALTLSFWVMKICATTLGETAGDLLSMTLHIGYAVSSFILVTLLAGLLTIQLSATRYVPSLYWGVILLTSTEGTTLSDFMDRTLELGYARGSVLLIVLLLSVLALWHKRTGSLSVAPLRDRASELFYWVAIIFSNTLGTAFGDFLSDSSGLGFRAGAFLIATLLVFLSVLYAFTAFSRITLFWVAFVLTRPFGAMMGDILKKRPEKGGLGFGTIGSSAVLAVMLIGLIVGASHKERIRGRT